MNPILSLWSEPGCRLVGVVQSATQSDPLLDHSSQTAIFIGVGLLSLASVVLLSILSRKIEHIVLFAIALSLVIIVTALML